MKNFMDPDSRFLDICQKLTQCVLCNFLWLIFCIPIFTIGAATKALYANMQALKSGNFCGIGSFFREFAHGFKTSTLIWLGILAAGFALAADYVILAYLDFPGRFLVLTVVIFLFLGLIFFTGMVFPLLAQFPCTVRECVSNGILLCFANGPKMLLVTLTNLLPVLLMILFPSFFLISGFVWVLFGFSGIALLNLRTLNPIFDSLRHREAAVKKEKIS